jgi:HEAT repeat protein
MKKEILLMFAISLLLTFAVQAQDLEQARIGQAKMERGKRENTALEAIANRSPSLRALRGDVAEMIAEAARTGDSALIPHLKVLADDAEERTGMGSMAFYAHIALVKLGDPDALLEIFAELSPGGIRAQNTAIKKLAQIGSKEAYQKLYELLDDDANRDTVYDDELVSPNSQTVMHELATIFDDTPKKPNGATSQDVAAWKAWVEKKLLIK